jgi:hypothetical protein
MVVLNRFSQTFQLQYTMAVSLSSFLDKEPQYLELYDNTTSNATVNAVSNISYRPLLGA